MFQIISAMEQESSDIDEIFQKYYKNKILSHKDLAAEELLKLVLDEEHAKLPVHLSSDERSMTLLKMVQARMLKLSSSLVLKLMPLMQNIIVEKENSKLDAELASINVPLMDVKDKSLLYKTMFNNFIDSDDSVSFACPNQRLLGSLTPRDLYCLTLFTFATCQRSKGDDCLMLFLSG